MYNFKQDFYADVRVEDRFTTTIAYTNGFLKEIKERNEKRAFIRVFDGKMWYFASTTDLSDIQNKLDGLYLQAKPNSKILKNRIVKKFEVNNDVKMVFALNSVRNIDIAQKKALLESYLPTLSSSPLMSMPTATYVDRNSIFEFSSSKGAYIKYDYQTCGIYLGCTLTSENDFLQADKQFGETEFNKLKGKKNEIIKSLEEQINCLKEGKSVNPGEYPVILSPEAAGIFAHESFGHKSEADFMLADEGIRREWQIGKTVASSLLSIVDCGKNPGSGYVPYDDEGTHARKNYLIKNGVLTSRLHNAQTSAYLGERVTGNARAIDCTFEPIVRMTNTYIEKGEFTKDELFAGVKFGYYIKSVKHGSGMSKFTIAPHIAYEIVDGKITRPVKISVITGDVFTTLGLIDGLSDKVELFSFVMGGCGKNEQAGLPVGFGGPYVRVSKMFVQ
ncbi:MAG: TldD/PmbA family protein [Clostridia bacterium]|nr:TldD/PmbA family protein [Clostridia bacterium]